MVPLDPVVEDGDGDALAAVAHVPGGLHVHVEVSAPVEVPLPGPLLVGEPLDGVRGVLLLLLLGAGLLHDRPGRGSPRAKEEEELVQSGRELPRTWTYRQSEGRWRGTT